MRYSVWSHGRLLGHTTLDFYPSFPTARMGWFEPTEIGERLMPVLTNLGPFHEAISREMAERPVADAGAQGKRRRALACDALRHKMTMEAERALRALELELRDETGRTISTDGIAVQDTEYLVAFASDDETDLTAWDPDIERIEEEMDEFSAALVELGLEEEPPAWDNDADLELASANTELLDEPDLPRYQIMVELVDAADVPIPERWMHDPDLKEMRDDIERNSRDHSGPKPDQSSF
jgi:hypothetical protein